MNNELEMLKLDLGILTHFLTQLYELFFPTETLEIETQNETIYQEEMNLEDKMDLILNSIEDLLNSRLV